MIKLLNRINIDTTHGEDFTNNLEKLVREILHWRDTLQADTDAVVVSSNKQLLAANRKIAALEKEVDEKKAELAAIASSEAGINSYANSFKSFFEQHNLSSMSNDIDVIVGRGTSTVSSPFYSHLFNDEAKSPIGGNSFDRVLSLRTSGRSPMTERGTIKRNTTQSHPSPDVKKELESKTSELESVWDRNIELHAQVTELKAQLAMSHTTNSSVEHAAAASTSFPLAPDEITQFQYKEVTKRRSASIISMFKNLSPIRKVSAPSLTAEEDKEQPLEIPVYNPEDIQKLVGHNAELQAEIGLLSMASDNHSNTSGRLILELEDALQSTGSELQALLEENTLLKKNVKVLEDSLSLEKESGEQKQLHVEALQAELDRTVLLIQDLDSKICSKAFELDELHDICRQYAIQANEAILPLRINTTTITTSDDASSSSDSNTALPRDDSMPSDPVSPLAAGSRSIASELFIAKNRISELERENKTMKTEIEARQEKSGDFVEETERMIKTIIQENNALQSEFESFIISSNKRLKATERRVVELENEVQDKKKQLLALESNDGTNGMYEAHLDDLGSELDAGTTERFLRQRLSEAERQLESKKSELMTVWDSNIELHAQILDLKAQVLQTDTKIQPDIVAGFSVPQKFDEVADVKRPKSAKKRSGSIISMFKNLSPIRKASAPSLTAEEDKEPPPEIPVYNPEDIQKIVNQNAELQAEIGLLSTASENHSNTHSRTILELEDALKSTGSELQALLEENTLLKKNVKVLEDSLSLEKESGEQKQLHVEALQAELDRTVLLIQDLDSKICSKAFELDELHDICRQYAIQANEAILPLRINTLNTSDDDETDQLQEIEAQVRSLKKFNAISATQLVEFPSAEPTAVQSDKRDALAQRVGFKSFVSDISVPLELSDENIESQGSPTERVGMEMQKDASTSGTSASGDGSFSDLFNIGSILGISMQPDQAAVVEPPVAEQLALQQKHDSKLEELRLENSNLVSQITVMKSEVGEIAEELKRMMDALSKNLGKSTEAGQILILSNSEPSPLSTCLQLLDSIAALIKEISTEKGNTKNSGNRLSISTTVPVIVGTREEVSALEEELKAVSDKNAALEKNSSQLSSQLDESKRSMNDFSKTVTTYRKVLEDVYREQYIVANQIKMSAVIFSQGKASKFMNSNPSNLEEDVLTQCAQLGDSVSSILDHLNEQEKKLHELREDILGAREIDADVAEQGASSAATNDANANDSILPDFNSIFSFTGLVPVSSPVAASTPTAKSAPSSSVSSPRLDLQQKVLAGRNKTLEQDNLTLKEQKGALEQQLSEVLNALDQKKKLEQQLAVAVTSINQKKDLEQQVAAMAEELDQKKNLEQQLAAAGTSIIHLEQQVAVMAGELAQRKDLEEQLAAAEASINQKADLEQQVAALVRELSQKKDLEQHLAVAGTSIGQTEVLEQQVAVMAEELAQRKNLEQQLAAAGTSIIHLEQQVAVMAGELAQRKDLEQQLEAAKEQIIQNSNIKATQREVANENNDSIIPGLNSIFSFSGFISNDSARAADASSAAEISSGQDLRESALASRCEKLESENLDLQQQKKDLEQQLLSMTTTLGEKKNLDEELTKKLQLAAVTKELKSREAEIRAASASIPLQTTQQNTNELSSSLGSLMFKLFREDTFVAEDIPTSSKRSNGDKWVGRTKPTIQISNKVRALKEQNAVSMPQVLNTTAMNLWTAAESSQSTSSLDQSSSKYFEADIFAPISDSSSSCSSNTLKQAPVEIIVSDKVVSTQPVLQLSPTNTRNKKTEDFPASNTSLAFAMQQIEQLQTEIRSQEEEQRKMTEQLTLYRDSSAVPMKVLEANLQQLRGNNSQLSEEKSALAGQLTKAENELMELTSKYSTLKSATESSQISLVQNLEEKIAQREGIINDTRMEIQKLLQKFSAASLPTTGFDNIFE